MEKRKKRRAPLTASIDIHPSSMRETSCKTPVRLLPVEGGDNSSDLQNRSRKYELLSSWRAPKVRGVGKKTPLRGGNTGETERAEESRWRGRSINGTFPGRVRQTQDSGTLQEPKERKIVIRREKKEEEGQGEKHSEIRGKPRLARDLNKSGGRSGEESHPNLSDRAGSPAVSGRAYNKKRGKGNGNSTKKGAESSANPRPYTQKKKGKSSRGKLRNPAETKRGRKERSKLNSEREKYQRLKDADAL